MCNTMPGGAFLYLFRIIFTPKIQKKSEYGNSLVLKKLISLEAYLQKKKINSHQAMLANFKN